MNDCRMRSMNSTSSSSPPSAKPAAAQSTPEALQDRASETDGDIGRHARGEGAGLSGLEHQAEVAVVRQLLDGVRDPFDDGLGRIVDRTQLGGKAIEKSGHR